MLKENQETKPLRGGLTMSSLCVVVKVDYIGASYFSEQTVAAPTAQCQIVKQQHVTEIGNAHL